MLNLKYNPTPFHSIDYEAETKKELNNNELNAFLLIHGYIEAYLREWLFIIGGIKKTKVASRIIKETERITFSTLLIIHLILGNIDQELYDKLSKMNKMRNALVHELIKVDMESIKNREKIKKATLAAITFCDEVFKGYKKGLDAESKVIR